MKKFFLISILMGAMPLSMLAQDDDLYFVPKKKASTEVKTDRHGMPQQTYYAGSSRSVDEYNRRGSRYEVIGNDSINDIIDFSSVQGVYPDSLGNDDFALTKKMSRFEDYDLADNVAFWAGYRKGRSDWGWYSPWYYRTYGWYSGFYDPWYYGGWYGWYDPWYAGHFAYGWYDPWYSWYGGWYGWASPYHWNWRYPYYYYGGGGGGRHYAWNGNTGTINRNGSTRSRMSGRYNGLSANRNSSLRDRTIGNHRAYGGHSNNSSSRGYNDSGFRSGNSVQSSSGNFSGSRSSGSFSSGGGSSRSSSSGGGGGGRSGISMGGRR